MRKVTIDWEQLENVEWKKYTTKKTGKEKRKLLITTDNFLPRWDGITRFLSEIVPRLQENYDVTIVAPDYGRVEIKGVTIHKIPLIRMTFSDYTPPRFAYKTIKRLVRHADIVFNQALGPIGICTLIAAKRVRRPLLSYIHSIEWELVPRALTMPLFRAPLIAITKLIMRMLYNRCTTLILPSDNIAEHFTWQGVTTAKRVVHLGVDTEKFTPKKSSRRELKLPETAFIIGYHGRLSYEKNLMTLLRAFKQVDIKNKRLLIVGDGVDKLRSRLENVPGVIVRRSTDNVVPYLQAMDLYVQPSLTETTSLAVLEAMACGLPVVSSKVGFIQYYIINEKSGLFFDNKSTYDLVLKLQRMYENPEMLKAMGKEARTVIEDGFKWDNTAKGIKDVIDSI